MYRNLEEDRRTKIEAADGAEQVECVCTCGESETEDEADVPAANKTAMNLKIHYDING